MTLQRLACIALLTCASCALTPPSLAAAAAVAPEIQRDTGTAQAVGQVHTLRNIPEACVRLQGQFTGDANVPYRLDAVPPGRCAPRAKFVEAKSLKTPPTIASGWILNDVIRVPSATCTTQQAAISVWRRQVDPAAIKLDPQGRMRLYMKDDGMSTPAGAKSAPIGLYTATLEVVGKCG